MQTVLDILRRSEDFLARRGVDAPKLAARVLLADCLGLEQLQLFLQHDRPLTDAELTAVREPLRRLGAGEPLAYVLGRREFWSLDFQVGPGVLIPRPDTETLVEVALALLDGRALAPAPRPDAPEVLVLDPVAPPDLDAPAPPPPEAAPAPADDPAPEGERDPVYVADVCAGSGCVGIALASERPALRVYATEASPEAMVWLKRNIQAHGLGARVAALAGDLLAPIPAHRPVDWVVANPPYIASGELPGLEVARHEPGAALDGGPDGLDLYRRLIPEAARRARRGVAVEIGHDQGPAVAALFREAGLIEVVIKKDLGGRDRVVAGLRPRA